MRNFISIKQLDDEGYNVTFTSGAWKVTKRAMVIARGNKIGTWYMTFSCKNIVVVDGNVNSNLWHCRLSHMSKKGMKVFDKLLNEYSLISLGYLYRIYKAIL